MSKKVMSLKRYYEILAMAKQSERKLKETAPGFLMGVQHNLVVSDLNRRCWRKNGPSRKNRRT